MSNTCGRLSTMHSPLQGVHPFQDGHAADLKAALFSTFFVAVLQIAQAARSLAKAPAELLRIPTSNGKVPFSLTVSLASGDASVRCCIHHATACIVHLPSQLPGSHPVRAAPSAIQHGELDSHNYCDSHQDEQCS